MLTEREIIAQAAKNLPSCDCTARCSDDSRIEDGTHAPCKSYVSWAQSRIDQRQLELDGRRMQKLRRLMNSDCEKDERRLITIATAITVQNAAAVDELLDQ
ncbi:hypothetical protein [Comamonas thiooxydans]|uniref:hypothetical protein n=1 Tax=Comamonas thiooxydans TaxID=363952 RepID=UPI001CCCD41B|nr:hypothetical protein [Comamonas thiooxydans]UBQ44608.1 hypothetical protein LCH15_26000 [Comamonas thiooxydans]